MAKKKAVKRRAPVRAKARTRTITKVVRKRARRVGSALKPMNAYLGGAGYGLFRNKASGFVNANIASRLPFGQYADEVAFTGIAFAMAKWGKKVLGVDMKKLGRDGLIVEGAMMGSQLGNMVNLPNIGGTTKSASTGFPV